MWGLCTGQACVRVWPFGGGRRLAGWLRGRERRLPKAFHRACQRGSAEQEIRASTAAAGQVVPTGHDRAIPGSELLAALTTSRRSPGWCPVPVTGVCVPCGRSSPAANCCAGSAGVPGECEACVLRDQGGRWQGRDREPLRPGMPHIEHVACWRAEIRLCAHSAVRDSFVWYACGRVVRHAVGQWLVSSDSLAGNLLGFIGTMRQGGVGYRTLF